MEYRSKIARIGEEDIISNKLPTKVIGHILSFLPTKDAVRTSVLSKRWRNHWRSITKLDLDDSVFYRYSPAKRAKRVCSCCKVLYTISYFACDQDAHLTLCWECYHLGNCQGLSSLDFREVDIENEILAEQRCFEQFVDEALVLTSNLLTIEGFSLVINYKHGVSVLNTWISNILNRGVKNIRIHSSCFELPFSTFTSQSLINSYLLEELELVLRVPSTLKVPTISVHLGHLKLLKLSGIVLNIDPYNDRLTLSLPVLKKFEIKNCTWSKGKSVIVEAPLLECVSIEQYLNEVPFHDLGAAIKFDSLHLKEFTYCGYDISETIFLSGILSYASFEVILKQGKREVSGTRCLAFLLQQIKPVKYIKFEGIKLGRQADIPEFAMLSHLELGLVTVKVLLGLLRKSPVLKTLVLKGISKFAEQLLNSGVVPSCMASTLQVVKFDKVHVDEHELFLAKFFIKNGMRKLERMNFSLASQKLRNSKIVKKYKEKLDSFKKGYSSAVEFSFE